jgi:hypothetical protein
VVPCFLIFGVQGEFETFAEIFEPLAVFFSTQITLSYCGNIETVRAHFPRIIEVQGGRAGWREKRSGERSSWLMIGNRTKPQG